MAERGGRRQQTWGAPVSWREADALEAARALCGAHSGPQGRADWLLGLAETVLRNGVEDPTIPGYVRQRAKSALAALASERAATAANPPRVGRPPATY